MAVVQLIFIVAVLVAIPVTIVWAIVDHMKHGKNRPRRSGGGGLAGALLELDRLAARPSVEHVVEAQNLVLGREEDDGDGNVPPGASNGQSRTTLD